MGSKRIFAFCLGLVLAASVLSACGGETVLPEGSIPDAVGTEDFQTEDAPLPTQGPSTPTALPDAALSGYFREDARACIFYNQADGVSVESKTIMEFRYTANAREIYENEVLRECIEFDQEGYWIRGDYYDEKGNLLGVALYDFKKLPRWMRCAEYAVSYTAYNPDGNATVLTFAEYGPDGNVVRLTVTEPENRESVHVFEFEWLENAVIRQMQRDYVDRALVRSIESEYDIAGNRLRELQRNSEDALDFYREYTATGSGAVMKEFHMDSGGHMYPWASEEYDQDGQLIHKFFYYYDGRLHKYEEYKDGNKQWEETYHMDGSIQSNAGRKYEYEYDDENILRRIHCSLNGEPLYVEEISYDGNGNQSKRTLYYYDDDRTYVGYEAGYDEAGHLIWERDTMYLFYRAEYDDHGNILVQNDLLHNELVWHQNVWEWTEATVGQWNFIQFTDTVKGYQASPCELFD